MTPQEQIAYLRQNVHQHWNDGEMLSTILAVCDLAERALWLQDAFLTLAEHACAGIDGDGDLCPECRENVARVAAEAAGR